MEIVSQGRGFAPMMTKPVPESDAAFYIHGVTRVHSLEDAKVTPQGHALGAGKRGPDHIGEASSWLDLAIANTRSRITGMPVPDGSAPRISALSA
jgi:hypothetical protein